MLTIKSYKRNAEKLLWTLAPLAFGSFVWAMGWGFGSYLVPYYPLNYLLRVVVASAITIFFFRKTFDYATQHYELQFFGYTVKLPSWWIFIALALLVSCFNFTPLARFETMQSLIGGVFVSAIIEEFIARSYFVKYKMSAPTFIVLNILSSLAFTFMHIFYTKDMHMDVVNLLSNHFEFSFMLGIIVYKTQRIELSIILHMLSNLLRYTIPVCILHCVYPSFMMVLLSLMVGTVILLALAGCSYKRKA
ncbi:MAG: lysostaphin resistance A-like protein [Candidatus Babeliales bacterium]